MSGGERVFVALDTPDPARARELARILAGRVGGLKVGLELFTAAGPGLVRELGSTGTPVFLDLKLHDIPNTVGAAAAAAARTGAALLTVHALGGEAMIRAAVAGAPGVVVLAVTVLTSHAAGDLPALGIAGPPADAVGRLASVARRAGAGGIVCSALEIEVVRRAFPEALVVVPGIRPAGADKGDQARVATPASAVASGADRLVVGRPITAAPDPAAAAEAIAREIAAGTPA